MRTRDALRVLFVELPCAALIGFPVAVIAYLLTWVEAGWYCGRDFFESSVARTQSATWKIPVPPHGARGSEE